MTCRDESGVIVRVTADNYFGYGKKEVKTQISYPANLFGLCEKEHAGGALVFPRHDLDEELIPDPRLRASESAFEEVAFSYAVLMYAKRPAHCAETFSDVLLVAGK
jgi:phosphoenolpyruvate carboxykinase (diphosphate)